MLFRTQNTNFTLVSFVRFCDRLHPLLSSGISIQLSLTLLAKNTRRADSAVIFRLHGLLLSGVPFLQALYAVFPPHIPFHLGSVTEIPELPLFLEEISGYYSQKIIYLNRLRQKLTYPVFLMVTLGFLSVFMLFWMLPNFIKFYESASVDTPPLLMSLLALKSWITSGLLGLLVALTLVSLYFWKELSGFFVRLIFPYRIADILWLMAIFLKNGVPLKTVIGIISLPPTHPLTPAYHAFSKQCLETGHFSAAFSTYFCLNAYATELLFHSEKSGQLTRGLLQVSSYLRSEEVQKFDRFLNLLQPILLLILSIWIGMSIYFSFGPMLASIQHLG